MLTWENHSCMPLRPAHDFMPQLSRYRDSGVDVVSLNVTFDLMDVESSFRVLSFMRQWVQCSDSYALGGTVAELESNKRQGKTSVVFDVEGLKGIGEQFDLLATYHALGVRWASPIYNRANQFGAGCMDTEDTGLTTLGRDLVRRMNELGMVACCSHTSRRASLDIIEASSQPVIFSHSNAHAVHAHPRNITDEQIRACAARGGVIGINGIGIFIGRNDTSIESFTRHICHVADLVGVEHVGVSLDHAFDLAELEGFFEAHRDLFPAEEYGNTLEMVPPEVFSRLPQALADCGMGEQDVRLVLGGNWERIAREVWRP
jgi:membrane dipeptidase